MRGTDVLSTSNLARITVNLWITTTHLVGSLSRPTCRKEFSLTSRPPWTVVVAQVQRARLGASACSLGRVSLRTASGNNENKVIATNWQHQKELAFRLSRQALVVHFDVIPNQLVLHMNAGREILFLMPRKVEHGHSLSDTGCKPRPIVQPCLILGNGRISMPSAKLQGTTSFERV